MTTAIPSQAMRSMTFQFLVNKVKGMITTHANRHLMVPVWANPPGQVTRHGVVVQTPRNDDHDL